MFKNITNKPTLFFIIGYHLLLLVLLPVVFSQLSWAALAFFMVTFSIAGLSITAGYHRLYAHRTYAAHPVVEWAVLLGSTLALQWSALNWSHDHRIHHNNVDTDDDPYSIEKGFWYAHVTWLFSYKVKFNADLVQDLLKNPRVVFQDKHFLTLTVIVNLAVFGIGCLFLSPLVSFVVGFLLRVFAVHHCTWFINSLAHTWGAKTYARELSAVDNALLALVTFGEGYHNYHHAFANDYRNGIRWYHFDPTKWIIWTLSKLGLATNLRSLNHIHLHKKLIRIDKEMILEAIGNHIDDTAAEIRRKLESLSASYEEKANLLSQRMREFKGENTRRKQEVKAEIRRLRGELRKMWREWLEVTKEAVRRYPIEHHHHHA